MNDLAEFGRLVVSAILEMRRSDPAPLDLSVAVVGSAERCVVIRFLREGENWGWCRKVTDEDGAHLFPVDPDELAAQLYVDFMDDLNGAWTLDDLDDDGATTWLGGRPPVN
jgi:hypothetical protein